MVEFQNLSDALNHQVGSVEVGKSNITVGDYLEIRDSSWAIGRFFTQVKLLFQGKGWVNTENSSQLIAGSDWETLAAIDRLCSQFFIGISKANSLQGLQMDVKHPPSDKFIMTVVKSTLGEGFTAKKLKDAKKEVASIQAFVKEIGIEMDRKNHQIIDPIFNSTENIPNPKRFELISQHPQLEGLFHKYILELANSPSPQGNIPSLHLDYGRVRSAREILHTKAYKTKEGENNKERIFGEDNNLKLDSEGHIIWSFPKGLEIYSSQGLLAGFEEWLAEGITEGKIGSDDLANIQNAANEFQASQEKLTSLFEISKALGPWDSDTFKLIKEDTSLKKYFEKYVQWTHEQEGNEDAFTSKMKDALLMINSPHNSEYFPENSPPNYGKFSTDQEYTVISGFKEWLTKGIEEETFSQTELIELFGSPTKGAETGLCRLNPGNTSGLMELRAKAGKYRTPFAEQLSIKLQSVDRENYKRQHNLDWLLSNRLVKPLIYENRHPVFNAKHADIKVHPNHNFGKVKMSPIMQQARDQLERLIEGSHIKLQEFGENEKGDKNDSLHQHFGDFKLEELEGLIRDKLNEKPVLLEAFIEFLPRHIDQESVAQSDLLMLATDFKSLEDHIPKK